MQTIIGRIIIILTICLIFLITELLGLKSVRSLRNPLPLLLTKTPESVVMKDYYCYIIYSGNRTYTGYTVDLKRRLRQHNQEIKGGARYTKCRENWKYLTVMTSSNWTSQRAMQIEYIHKYPTRKKPKPRQFCRPSGRILSLSAICSVIREDINIFVTPDFIDICKERLVQYPSVVVHPLIDIFDYSQLN